jgi:5-methylcytosine-specific restriction endonuclease McrA
MAKINRKQLSKANRLNVYYKYDKHCAYCGCELEYRDMQIDHIKAVYKSELDGENADESIENLMPACRMCNFYKSTFSIEQFRERLHSLHTRLKEQFIFRLALKYGIVELDLKPIEFYFEKNEKEGEK